jgi:hypothetical protein
VLQHANAPTDVMLDKLKSELETFAQGEPFPNDISIVSVLRKVQG